MSTRAPSWGWFLSPQRSRTPACRKTCFITPRLTISVHWDDIYLKTNIISDSNNVSQYQYQHSHIPTLPSGRQRLRFKSCKSEEGWGEWGDVLLSPHKQAVLWKLEPYVQKFSSTKSRSISAGQSPEVGSGRQGGEPREGPRLSSGSVATWDFASDPGTVHITLFAASYLISLSLSSLICKMGEW